jgi:hypothetical protein
MDQFGTSVRLDFCRETPSNIEEKFFLFLSGRARRQGDKNRAETPPAKRGFNRTRPSPVGEARLRSGLTTWACMPRHPDSLQRVGLAVAYAGAGCQPGPARASAQIKPRTRGNCLHQRPSGIYPAPDSGDCGVPLSKPSSKLPKMARGSVSCTLSNKKPTH